MRFVFRSTLEKAKKLPYGSIRKWADGYYIKVGDHKWKKHHGTEIAHKQLKDDNLFHKKDLRDDFTEVVHNYAEHLASKNIHPKQATPDTDDEFWMDVFGHEDWFDEPSERKFAEKVRKVVMKFHQELYRQGKQEIADDAKHEKEIEKTRKTREKEDDKNVKDLSKRQGIQIKDPLLAAKAAALVESRRTTHEMAMRYFDGKQVGGKNSAKDLMGMTIKINGVTGVVQSYAYYPSKGRILHSIYAAKAGMVASFNLITENGMRKVDNTGAIQIMPDPMRAKGGTSNVPELERAGISEMVFDSDISSMNKTAWENDLKSAFKEFNSKHGINFNDKVKIHVYGSGGPKRGATADYSSRDKVIRLSAKKSGSFAALAHELGHALDDKMNGWHGTDGWKIQEIVRAYGETPQGKSEMQRLESEREATKSPFSYRRKVSNYSSWMNKPEERFARCFETYIAKTCPTWKKLGFAKEVIDDESFKKVKPLFDKLLKDKAVKKAFLEVLAEVGLV